MAPWHSFNAYWLSSLKKYRKRKQTKGQIHKISSPLREKAACVLYPILSLNYLGQLLSSIAIKCRLKLVIVCPTNGPSLMCEVHANILLFWKQVLESLLKLIVVKLRIA